VFVIESRLLISLARLELTRGLQQLTVSKALALQTVVLITALKYL
jgi:hypothetical protein